MRYLWLLLLSVSIGSLASAQGISGTFAATLPVIVDEENTQGIIVPATQLIQLKVALKGNKITVTDKVNKWSFGKTKLKAGKVRYTFDFNPLSVTTDIGPMSCYATGDLRLSKISAKKMTVKYDLAVECDDQEHFAVYSIAGKLKRISR